jgi:hypothetical protein
MLWREGQRKGRGPVTIAAVHHVLVCLGLLADKVVS